MRVDRALFDTAIDAETLTQPLDVRADWSEKVRIRAIYAFLLSIQLTAVAAPRTVVLEDSGGMRTVRMPDSADHAHNMRRLEGELAEHEPIARHAKLRIEGTGQVIGLRIDSNASPFRQSDHDVVDVAITLRANGQGVTLTVDPEDARIDTRPATLVARRLATLLEGLLPLAE